ASPRINALSTAISKVSAMIAVPWRHAGRERPEMLRWHSRPGMSTLAHCSLGEFRILRQTVRDLLPGRLGGDHDVVIGANGGGVEQSAERDMGPEALAHDRIEE